MNNNDKQIVSIAINLIQAILSYGEPTAESISELLEIRQKNKQVILEHLNAINSITGKAIEILGGNMKGLLDAKNKAYKKIAELDREKLNDKTSFEHDEKIKEIKKKEMCKYIFYRELMKCMSKGEKNEK